MSFEHLGAIRKMQLSSASKAVLTWAAWHACRGCGLAWAGVMVLGVETCLNERTVRRALNDLAQRRLLIVVGYGQGGRGRATEYLVVPDMVKLPGGTCATCGKVADPHRHPHPAPPAALEPMAPGDPGGPGDELDDEPQAAAR